MAGDVINAKSVTGSSAFVAYTQHLSKFALVGKRKMPKVEGAVVVLCYKKDNRHCIVLIFAVAKSLKMVIQYKN